MRAFVDTAIFRYASRAKVRTYAKKSDAYITKAATGEILPISMLRVDIEMKEIPNRVDLEEDISAIRNIANLAIDKKILLCYSHEVNLELLCQPMVDVFPGRFHGAPSWMVHSPLLSVSREKFDAQDLTPNPLKIYPTRKFDPRTFAIHKDTKTSVVQDFVRDELLSTPLNSFMHGMGFINFIASIREITNYSANTPELIFPLLKTFSHPRYKEILHTLNANGVGQNKQPNTYLDAMHLWAAEEAKCDVFLTLDTGIRNQYKNSFLRVMKPTELIGEIRA